MLEPILTTALEKAVSMGSRYLDDARKEVRQAEKNNVASCIKFLEAARAAVLGLEDELDEILIEAGMVARYEWECRSELFARIHNYLNRDRLRPILDGSLQGVSACYKFAAQDADGFFQRRHRRMQKAESVNDLLRLFGALSDYLKSLSATMTLDRVNYVGPSGINIQELLDLEKYLDDSHFGAKDIKMRKEEIRKLAAAAQETRLRRGLPLAAETRKVIQELNVVFRLETMD
ncbi:MAG: hypothetical protein WA869_06645 [Alloacidobacterium sp.]|jgi:hypothetical protein